MDHTVLPANNTMPAFPSWRSPDVTTQQLRQQTSNCSSLLIYRHRKDERLSWPGWLTYSGWLTHISGHPSATSRARDSESTSVKDQCSTAGPRNQQRSCVLDGGPYPHVEWKGAILGQTGGPIVTYSDTLW